MSRKGRLRIIAGEARGRLLAVPDGEVRPTSDRAREAIFNALGSMGALDGVFVDFFAGSGALGLEALSRGATHATFLESDPRALEVLTANVEALGFADRATVHRADSLRSAVTLTGDVALCDPPYAFDGWPALLGELSEAGFEVVVIESDREIDPGAGWATSKQRRYAGTVVTIARRESAAVD